MRSVLLVLFGAPVAWAVHLTTAYLAVVIWCAMGWTGVELAIGALTLVCAAAAVASGLGAVRLWRRGQASREADREPGGASPWDARMGERGARTAFLGVTAIFMAGTFTWVILLQGIPPLLAPACPAGTVP